MKQFYVYTHARPDGQVFYVGKGHGGRAWKFKRVMNPYYAAIIAKYGQENIVVQTFPVENEDIAFQLERLLIAELKAMGIKLANMTDGGEGCSGRPVSEKVRENARHLCRFVTPEASERGRQKLIGRIKSPQECANIAKALTGKKRPPEVMEKVAAKQRGRKLSPERKAITIAALEKARVAAAEWHGSEEGIAWHTENGKRCWDNKPWYEINCQQCNRPFMTPFPTRAKYCHQNCKMLARRIRLGGIPQPIHKLVELTGKKAAS